jgi:hypothetical protein
MLNVGRDRQQRNSTGDEMSPNGENGGGAPTTSEGSLRGSFVALVTPFFALFAGWLSGVVANAVPGVTLDKNQIVAFMVAVSTTALGGAYKWLQGWQQHEQRVANEIAVPVKKVEG